MIHPGPKRMTERFNRLVYAPSRPGIRNCSLESLAHRWLPVSSPPPAGVAYPLVAGIPKGR